MNKTAKWGNAPAAESIHEEGKAKRSVGFRGLETCSQPKVILERPSREIFGC